VLDVVRLNRLRWFGHVKRKSDDDDDWLKKYRQLMIEGRAGRGRGRMTWLECVRWDVEELELRVDDVRDGQVWRG